MSLDVRTEAMLADAYEEAYLEAIAQGEPPEIARREGFSAVSMFLVALTGCEHAGTLIGIEALSARWVSKL